MSEHLKETETPKNCSDQHFFFSFWFKDIENQELESVDVNITKYTDDEYMLEKIYH